VAKELALLEKTSIRWREGVRLFAGKIPGRGASGGGAGQCPILPRDCTTHRQAGSEKLYLEEEIRSELDFEEIVGESPALKRVLSQARTVAPSDATVLILG